MDGVTTHMGLTLMVVAAIAGLCFVAYLLFLVFVILRTGSTDGLRDVATAMNAYKPPLVSWSKKAEKR